MKILLLGVGFSLRTDRYADMTTLKSFFEVFLTRLNTNQLVLEK